MTTPKTPRPDNRGAQEDDATNVESNGAGQPTMNGSLQGGEFSQSTQINTAPERYGLDWALYLAGQGMYIFPTDHPDASKCMSYHTVQPCDGQRGKHPVGKWQEISTRDQLTIEGWWNQHRGRVNFAIDCGKSGIVVVDEDDPDALKQLLAYADDQEPLDTGGAWTDVMVTTGREGGGTHFYYRNRAINGLTNRQHVGEFGVDVRGTRGYVMAPGSKHMSGTYYLMVSTDVDMRALPVIPPGLADALTRSYPERKQKKTSGTTGGGTFEHNGTAFRWDDVEADAAEVGEGGQREFLLSAIGSLKRLYTPRAVIRREAHRIAGSFRVYRPEQPWTRELIDAIVDETFETFEGDSRHMAAVELVEKLRTAEDTEQWLSDEQRGWLASEEVRTGILRREHDRQAKEIHKAWMASKNSVPAPSVKDVVKAIREGKTVRSFPTIGLIDEDEQRRGLFYPGHVNVVFGSPSAAKSVVMAEVQARTLNGGGSVVHWEFDNNPLSSVVMRMINAGADLDAIEGRFHFITSLGERDALGKDVIASATVVTLDALDPAIGQFGENVNDTEGVDMVIRECFHPFTQHGACGIAIDHVGLENTDRQAGSRRKKSAPQGAVYHLKRGAALKPGRDGFSTLVLVKDNLGALGDEGRIVATARMHSEAQAGGEPGRVVTVFASSSALTLGEAKQIADASPAGQNKADNIVKLMDADNLPQNTSVAVAKEWKKGKKITCRSDVIEAAVRLRKARSEGGEEGG